jgi:hypothetical protein
VIISTVSAEPDDHVFTTITGKPASTLYKHLIEDLLTVANLREGPSGLLRSTYCFRHTYASFRLGEGVDVYFLADQMGTSVKMIEDHYGHVNTIKHADRVLQGMGGWDPIAPLPDDAEPNATQGNANQNVSAVTETNAKAQRSAKARQPARPRNSIRH